MKLTLKEKQLVKEYAKKLVGKKLNESDGKPLNDTDLYKLIRQVGIKIKRDNVHPSYPHISGQHFSFYPNKDQEIEISKFIELQRLINGKISIIDSNSGMICSVTIEV